MAIRSHHLQQMILDHVAQRSGFPDSTRRAPRRRSIGGRNLYMVDIAPVPKRLEDAVPKRSARMFWTVSLPR
jgi:hypothetical protein